MYRTLLLAGCLLVSCGEAKSAGSGPSSPSGTGVLETTREDHRFAVLNSLAVRHKSSTIEGLQIYLSDSSSALCFDLNSMPEHTAMERSLTLQLETLSDAPFAPGRYDLDGNVLQTYGVPRSFATTRVVQPATTCVIDEYDPVEAGYVEIETLTDAYVEGGYSLTMKSGAELSGRFGARTCSKSGYYLGHECKQTQ